MAERLGLVPTEGAERVVMSVKPGGVGGQVTFLRHQQKFISRLMRWRHVLTYLTPFPASLVSRAS